VEGIYMLVIPNPELIEAIENEGTWRANRGQPTEWTITYRGGRYRIDDTHTGRYRIDATRTPPHLDLIPDGGPDRGRTLPNIFQIDGDTLRLAWRLPPNVAVRPQTFDEKGIRLFPK
jgi:uncharacterized protein (TIGR03067 family)